MIMEKSNRYNLCGITQIILKNTTYSEEFIDIYIQDLSIRKKATHTAVSPDFPIIDLIFNYDLSKLRVQHYSFNEADDVTENDQYIYWLV